MCWCRRYRVVQTEDSSRRPNPTSGNHALQAWFSFLVARSPQCPSTSASTCCRLRKQWIRSRSDFAGAVLCEQCSWINGACTWFSAQLVHHVAPSALVWRGHVPINSRWREVTHSSHVADAEWLTVADVSRLSSSCRDMIIVINTDSFIKKVYARIKKNAIGE